MPHKLKGRNVPSPKPRSQLVVELVVGCSVVRLFGCSVVWLFDCREWPGNCNYICKIVLRCRRGPKGKRCGGMVKRK